MKKCSNPAAGLATELAMVNLGEECGVGWQNDAVWIWTP